MSKRLFEEDDDRRKKRRDSKWDPDEDGGDSKSSTGLIKQVAALPAQPQGEMQYAAVDNFRAANARYMDVARHVRARVYVGNIDLNTSEQTIRHIFGAFGAIHNVHMPKESGRSTGYCFVEYMDQNAANLAIASTQNFFLSGRHIRVSRPTEQRRPQVAPQGMSGVVAAPPTNVLIGVDPTRAELRQVTVSGLPDTFQVQDVYDFMQSYGKIQKCDILTAASQSAVVKPGYAGRASVEYDTELAAFESLRALQGFALKNGSILQLHLGLVGSQDAAVVKQSEAASIFAPAVTKVLCLENMVGPGEADEDLADEIREECENFGKVKDVKVHEIGAEKHVRVIVTFSEPGETAKAIKALHGRWFGGRKVKAESQPEE